MTDTTAVAPRESPLAQLLRHSRHVLAENPVTGFAFALFLLILLSALFGPQLAPYDPLASNTAQTLKPPNAQHWFGTDQLGRDVFSRVIVEKVDLQLGRDRATILYEYPLPQGALARTKPGSAEVAERFELYACGVELANAFGELTDPSEQRKRFEAAMDEKERIHGESYPVDENFLDALAQMPPASGIALGFDRLVMLATGAELIDQVIWTPVAEPDESA